MDQGATLLIGLLFILFCTSFVKIITVLGVLRLGLGLPSLSGGVAVIALSGVLTIFSMSPVFDKVGGWSKMFSGEAAKDVAKLEAQYRPFMEKNTDSQLVERFSNLEKIERVDEKAATSDEKKATVAEGEKDTSIAFPTLMVSFLVGQLQQAFELGFLLIVPFIVIDLLTLHLMMSLGIVGIAPFFISFPLKLLLFITMDGWALLAEKLLRSYGGV